MKTFTLSYIFAWLFIMSWWRLFASAAVISTVLAHGYFFDVNNTKYNVYQEESEIISMPVFVFDDVLKQYRSDKRKREPQFLGFDIQDDNIEIDMELAVPFLSVPTKKGVKRRNFANINVAAVIMAGIVAIVGTFLGGVTRMFRGDSFLGGKPWFRTGNKKKKQKRETQHENFVWETFQSIDNALLEIDFDITSCVQRSICWHVKESLANIEEEKASKFDKFIEGFINAEWKHHVPGHSLWNDALEAAKQGTNCEETFDKCSPSASKIQKKLRKFAKPKKSF